MPVPQPQPNGRHAPRTKIFQPAQMVRGEGGTSRVHLLNISATGALVYGEQVPGVGEDVRLVCGIPLGAARVEGTDGRRFGLAFAAPLVPAEIEALVRIQDAVIRATTQRLGLQAVRGMSGVSAAA